MEALIIVSIHLLVLVLWAADSRALEYIIQKFKFRRSMPQPVDADEENPFIIDRTKEKEKVDIKFEEMIKTAYGNSPNRWEAWGTHPSTGYRGEKRQIFTRMTGRWSLSLTRCLRSSRRPSQKFTKLY